MKLIMSNKYKVELMNENCMQEFEVLFHGPKDSFYEGVSFPTKLDREAHFLVKSLVFTGFIPNFWSFAGCMASAGDPS